MPEFSKTDVNGLDCKDIRIKKNEGISYAIVRKLAHNGDSLKKRQVEEKYGLLDKETKEAIHDLINQIEGSQLQNSARLTVKGKDYGKIVFPQQKLLTGDDCETDGGAGAPAARAGTGTEAPAVGKETPIMNFNKVFYKDGAYYLTGPNGKPTKVEYGSLMHNFNIPAWAVKNLQKSYQTAENFALILEGYQAKYPEKSTQLKKLTEQIKAELDIEDIRSGTRLFKVTDEMFYTLALDGTSRGGAINGSITQQLKSIFQNPDIASQRTAAVNFVRDELDQSDMAASDIIDRKMKEKLALTDKDLQDIAANLGTDTLKTLPGYKKVYDILGVDRLGPVLTKMRSAKLQAAKDWAEKQPEWTAEFKKQYPTVTITADILSKAEKEHEKMVVSTIGKKEIMFQYIDRYDISKDAEMKTLESILGVGWHMSDRSLDITGEVAKFIAVEAIAVAAGVILTPVASAAINAAAFGRNAYRGVKLVEAINAASKTKRGMTALGRLMGEGVAFEVGAAGVRSIAEGENMYSQEGFAQSIAMIGVIKSLGKVFQSGLGQKLGLQMQDGIPFWKQKIPFGKQIAIEGITLTGVSGVVGYHFDPTGTQWTPEQLAQAILMSALFKGATHFRVQKGKDGEIIVSPDAPTGQSRSTTVDPHAKARIEEEHGIGRTPYSAEESARAFQDADRNARIKKMTPAERENARKILEAQNLGTLNNGLQKIKKDPIGSEIRFGVNNDGKIIILPKGQTDGFRMGVKKIDDNNYEITTASSTTTVTKDGLDQIRNEFSKMVSGEPQTQQTPDVEGSPVNSPTKGSGESLAPRSEISVGLKGALIPLKRGPSNSIVTLYQRADGVWVDDPRVRTNTTLKITKISPTEYKVGDATVKYSTGVDTWRKLEQKVSEIISAKASTGAKPEAMPKQEPTPVINPKPAPDIVEPGQKTPDSILGENAYGNNVQRRIKNTLKEVKNPGDTTTLDNLGLNGWKVTKVAPKDRESNNQFLLEIPGREKIQVTGSEQLAKRIQNEAGQQKPAKEETPPAKKEAVSDVIEDQAAIVQAIKETGIDISDYGSFRTKVLGK